MRRLFSASSATLVTAALCLSASPAAAGAKQVPLTRVKALAPLTLGFSSGADVALASGNAATQAEWVPKAQAEGAQMVRLSVNWATVAPKSLPVGFNPSNPGDPDYNWTAVDAQVRELAAGQFKIMILVQGAPTWAEGAGIPKTAAAGTWEPNASDLGQFATAIASRYSGSYPDPLTPGSSLPAVHVWQAWDEPNLPTYLTPQWTQTSAGLVATSPTIYRSLENAFYPAIKAVSRSNFVVLAGLGPYGDPPSTDPTERMHPVDFEQSLLCVDPSGAEVSGCPGPTYFDAIDSHPYGIFGPNWHAYQPGDVSIPDVYKLVQVLHASESLGTAMPKGPKADWVTETSWDTNPPDPGGIPIQEQANWMEHALYNLWKQGVSTVLWWQIQDSPPIPNYAASYQAGTYYIGGGAKPSAAAFRFPLVTRRENYKTVIAWIRAPASGIVSVQEQTSSGWATVARARVKANEVFELPLDLIFRTTLRAKLREYTSLSWTQKG